MEDERSSDRVAANKTKEPCATGERRSSRRLEARAAEPVLTTAAASKTEESAGATREQRSRHRVDTDLHPDDEEHDEVQAAEAAMAAAEEAMAAHGPTTEQLGVEAAEAEQQASEMKSKAVMTTMKRRWSGFIIKHGEEYSYDDAAGPTIDLAMHFSTHGFNERVNEYSTTGERGMGDSWGGLQVRCQWPSLRIR